jgi:hypothetical protein
MTKNIHEESFPCVTCGTPGFFVTDHGLMCRQHAIAEAIDQEANSQDWTPTSGKQSDSAPIRTQGETQTE